MDAYSNNHYKEIFLKHNNSKKSECTTQVLNFRKGVVKYPHKGKRQ
jgi:hypothetical protein